MLFNSLEFAVFLPVVFIGYWMLPHKFRWVLLLSSSYYFYMSWNVEYVGLIFFTTLISYSCSRLLEIFKSNKTKRIILTITMLSSLGVLFFFKYFNFFSESVCTLLNHMAIPVHPFTLKVLLPVGISFYTFQTLSYVIDVYRGTVKPIHHFGKYALFISFFPQLVAGPIERTKNLMPQLVKERKFDYDQAVYGLRLMVWGYFKKIALADTLAIYVDQVYGNVTGYQGFSLMLASVLFSIQVYCDFSGYSDIAVGVAKLFGINLMRNFNSPYLAKSIREFWRRWHISLSTWFRDYVYIPLGGSRCGMLRRNWNLIVTFLVSGLWHGAAWNYIVWGGIHGIGQAVENMIFKSKKKDYKSKKLIAIKNVLLTGCIFVFCTFSWVFFRAESLSNAMYVFENMFVGLISPVRYLLTGLYSMNFTRLDMLNIFTMILILFVYDYLNDKIDVIKEIGNLKPVVRWTIYMISILMIVIFAPIQSGGEFIYFQF